MTFIAFLVGIGIGLGFVAPVLPQSFSAWLVVVVRSGGTVILAGMLTLAMLMVLLAVLYQGYLKA